MPWDSLSTTQRMRWIAARLVELFSAERCEVRRRPQDGRIEIAVRVRERYLVTRMEYEALELVLREYGSAQRVLSYFATILFREFLNGVVYNGPET